MSGLTAGGIPAPSIEYALVAPMLIVFGAAVLGVLVEAFLPRGARYFAQLGLTLLSLVSGFAAVIFLAGRRGLTAAGAIAIDGPALFLQGTVLLLAILAVLLAADRKTAGGDTFVAQAAAAPGSAQEQAAAAAGLTHTEVFPLILFAVSGMLLFPASNDLLTAFVALEVLSLPLYLLCGLARRRRLLSQEAALKYFLLGAFASAFFLYGVALLYGYAGTVELAGIAAASAAHVGTEPLLLLGMALLAVGLLFKVGVAPFHSWIPDVYQGAPTPVTGLMAAAVKIAAFGALLRVFYVGLGGMRWDWRPVMWVVAVLTMLIGAVVAITQTDIKRMLAYSSVAHAGFLLTGVIAVSREGLSATLFYLLAYGFTTLGAFAIVTLVRDPSGEATHLSRWAGLGRRSPLVAGAFALFLLALAGIPLTSGFIGKFGVFAAAAASGATPLVVVGVVSSAVAAFFYVRVIVLMFFSDPVADGPQVAAPSVLSGIVIGLGVAMTVVLGILPQPALNLTQAAALFIR